MTWKQIVWAAVIGAVAAAAILLVHLVVLPIDASWTVNRAVHHAWEVATGLAGAGGITWALWPRPKAPRRDLQRERIHRRAVAIVVMAMTAVALIVAGELLCDHQTKRYLQAAFPALDAIYTSAQQYRTAHNGEWPESLDSLSLAPSVLYYAYRGGPVAKPTPEAADGPPSYALAGPLAGNGQKRESRVLAYLLPGQSWAPLTAVVDKGGRIQMTGEDRTRSFVKAGR